MNKDEGMFWRDALKEQTPSKESEIDRKREARSWGLSETASWQDIEVARLDRDEVLRKESAGELGLSDTATWNEIRLASGEDLGNKKEKAALGLPEDASFLELLKARSAKRQNDNLG